MYMFIFEKHSDMEEIMLSINKVHYCFTQRILRPHERTSICVGPTVPAE